MVPSVLMSVAYLNIDNTVVVIGYGAAVWIDTCFYYVLLPAVSINCPKCKAALPLHIATRHSQTFYEFMKTWKGPYLRAQLSENVFEKKKCHTLPGGVYDQILILLKRCQFHFNV